MSDEILESSSPQGGEIAPTHPQENISPEQPQAQPAEPVEQVQIETPPLVVPPETQAQPQPQSQSPIQQIPAVVNPIPGLLAKAKAVLANRRRKKLEKILTFVMEKKKITNDDVQKLLRVSDATATRYLVQLVKEGRLRQTGHPRHAVYEFVG